MPTLREGDDLVTAGHQFRHPDRRLVRFRSGGEELHAVETGRETSKTRRQIDDRTRQHTAEKVGDRPHLACNRRDDVGMGVTENRTHLAGREIQDRPSVRIVDEAPFGSLDDDLFERRSITRQMFTGRGPEDRIVVQRHGIHP